MRSDEWDLSRTGLVFDKPYKVFDFFAALLNSSGAPIRSEVMQVQEKKPEDLSSDTTGMQITREEYWDLLEKYERGEIEEPDWDELFSDDEDW